MTPNIIKGGSSHATFRKKGELIVTIPKERKIKPYYVGIVKIIIEKEALIPSVVVQIPFFNSNEDVIGIIGAIICTVQVVILIASIFPTEAALKKTFNDDGSRK